MKAVTLNVDTYDKNLALRLALIARIDYLDAAIKTASARTMAASLFRMEQRELRSMLNQLEGKA